MQTGAQVGRFGMSRCLLEDVLGKGWENHVEGKALKQEGDAFAKKRLGTSWNIWDFRDVRDVLALCDYAACTAS